MDVVYAQLLVLTLMLIGFVLGAKANSTPRAKQHTHKFYGYFAGSIAFLVAGAGVAIVYHKRLREAARRGEII